MLIRLSFFLCIIAIVIKLIAIFYTNFDLFGDEAQYWVWSKDLNLGYYSKPPLLAWFLNGYTGVFGSSFVSLKVFPILVYFFLFDLLYFLNIKFLLNPNKTFYI